MTSKDVIEQMVLEGLKSCDPIEVTPQMWDELRQKLRERRKKSQNP